MKNTDKRKTAITTTGAGVTAALSYQSLSYITSPGWALIGAILISFAVIALTAYFGRNSKEHSEHQD
ncbi:hypothetical protein PUF88_04560 [Lactobacillaceae bacterium L1_55_11]|nr:hypothetical protein [Lactobacillaceae bacterium L1_55_11]